MKELSLVAQAAKAIRRELKKAFPKTKFSVTSKSYSMGNSVQVDWTDGPDTEAVNSIIKKYQYGHFDGMTDSYEFSNNRNDIPQAMFVTASRHISNSILEAAFTFAKGYFNWMKEVDSLESKINFNGLHSYPKKELITRLWKHNLTNGFKSEMLRAI